LKGTEYKGTFLPKCVIIVYVGYMLVRRDPLDRVLLNVASVNQMRGTETAPKCPEEHLRFATILLGKNILECFYELNMLTIER
jgi:hypothetical protein